MAKVVVYHSIPTSNHNALTDLNTRKLVVYHSIPTSNHNLDDISHCITVS